MFHLLEGNGLIFTWVEDSDWKIPTQLSPALWHFSAMLPEKGYNVTDISQATVAILGFMGVTTLTSNTGMTKRPEKPQKPIMAATISGCPVPTGFLKNMVWSTVISPNGKRSQSKVSLERYFASSCQSPGSSFQSVARCQLHIQIQLSCWICQVSLMLYHCAILPVSKLRAPFPMSPHLASTQ